MTVGLRSRRKISAAIASLGVLASAAVSMSHGHAATGVTKTFTTTVDTYVSAASPSTPHGDYAYLRSCPMACATSAQGERRVFVRFDVSGLPAGARVAQATLKLYATSSVSGVIAARPVTGTFSESTTTYANQPAAGNSIGHRTSVVAGAYNDWDVTRAVSGNGSVSLQLYSESGARADFVSSEDARHLGPQLAVSYEVDAASVPAPVTTAPVVPAPVTTAPVATAPVTTAPGTTAPTAAPAGPLPIDLPSQATLKASNRKVFAHYFTPYPISLDNQAGSTDYYARNYLQPSGENGKFAAIGGLLRDRPLPRSPLTGDWAMEDMKTEVRRASAAGLDGFTMDMLNVTSGPNWTRQKLLVQAAAAADPKFKIQLMPDMTILRDPAALAVAVAELAKSPSVFRLADGRVVISPFKAEAQTAAWWSSWISRMSTTYGIKVAFVPTFLDFGANAAAFAPISYGFSNWGDRNPLHSANDALHAQKAHAMGKIWMQPVSVQDTRPNGRKYDEAANTENFRTTWEAAIAGKADWVQVPTWNDYSENTHLAPSAKTGWSNLDLASYYIAKFKSGASPAIVRDTVYLSSRLQPFAAKPTGGQTSLMVLRGGTPARDTVEVLSFLTAPATVTASIAGKVTTYTAPAGMSAKVFPLGIGANSVSVARNGVVTAKTASKLPIRSSLPVQDLNYYASSSGRP